MSATSAPPGAPSLVLPTAPGALLRRVCFELLPGLAHHSLFTAALVTDLLRREGTVRTRSAAQDAGVQERYALTLARGKGRLRAQGRGLSDRGCTVWYEVSWPDESPTAVLAVDPHALAVEAEGPITLTGRAGPGPVYWASRAAGGRRTRTRRLPDDATLAAIRAVNTGLRAGEGRPFLPLTGEQAFVRALSRLAALGDTKTVGSIVCLKQRPGPEESARLLSAWPLEGGGFGFVEAPSSRESTLDDGSRLLISPGSLRLLRWAFDTLRELPCVFLSVDPAGRRWESCFESETARVRLVWTREDAVGDSADVQAVPVATVLARVHTLRGAHVGPVRALSPLADALKLAADFAAPGLKGVSAVRLDAPGTEADPVLRARTSTGGAALRLGPNTVLVPEKNGGEAEVLILDALQARTASRLLRGLAADFGLRQAHVALSRDGKAQLLALTEPGVRSQGHALLAGCVIPRCPSAEALLLTATVEADPESPVFGLEADALLAAASLALAAGRLPALCEGAAEEEPALVSVGPGGLRIETGSGRHAVGASCPFVRTERVRDPDSLESGAKWLALKIPFDTLSTGLRLLESARRLPGWKGAADDPPFEIALQMKALAARSGLFLTLTRGETVVARVALGESVLVGPARHERLPVYTRISPFWAAIWGASPAPEPDLPLPQGATLSALTQAARAFCLVGTDATISPMHQALTCLDYGADPAAVLGSNSYRGISLALTEQAFGGRPLLVPPGALDALSVLRDYDPEARFTLDAEWLRLGGARCHLLWRLTLPEGAPSAFPRGPLGRVLLAEPREARPGPRGLESGLGSPGLLELTVSLPALRERAQQLASVREVTRVLWVIGRDGRHALLPWEEFESDAPSLQALVGQWDSPADPYLIALDPLLLAGALTAGIGIAAALEQDSLTVSARILPHLIRLQSGPWTITVSPMQVAEEDAARVAAVQFPEA